LHVGPPLARITSERLAMSRVLVVDDSAVDRVLVAGLLKQDPVLVVEFAEDGEAGLAAARRSPPDVVVTDLHMPRLNGLELVRKIRERFPAVPVVLMTAKGSEEIAVQALAAGASHYVPKRALAKELLETVQNVLNLAKRQWSERELMAGMTRMECDFVLPNDARLIPPLVNYLQNGLKHLGVCGDAAAMQAGVALEETLINAVYHGNLEVGSELRDGEDYSAYYKLARERAALAPYNERRVRIHVRMTPREACFVIRDEGPGFDVAKLPDPTDPDYFDRVSGRGLLLVRSFMNEVRYNDRGNEITMIKRRPDDAGDVLILADESADGAA
jgi:CheY-like chemotaxis protein